MFAANEPGFVYDNNDLSTLFADAGGFAAASVNGPVGLQLDKRFSLAQGADARANGAIALVGTATAATYNAGTGVGSVTRAADASNQSFIQFSGLTANTWYRFQFSVISATLNIRQGTQAGAAFVSPPANHLTSVWCLSSATGTIALTAAANATTATFTLASMHSVAGAHRYQGTSAARPTLRGTPTGPDTLGDAGSFASPTGWTAPVAGAAISGGTLNFNGITSISNGATITSYTPVPAPVVGRVYRIVYTITAGTTLSLSVNYGGTVGTARNLAGTYTEYLTATSTAGLVITARSADGARTGALDNITVYDVTADVVAAPYGMQFDGVDDGMIAATQDFTGTDAMTLCMGIRKLSDSTAAIPVEFGVSTSTADGSFGVFAPSSGGGNNIRYSSRGTATASASIAAIAPITLVMTGTSDISADSCVLRINGAQVASAAADQGTGNYTAQVIYFSRRAGISLPFNGLDYGGVCLGRTATAAELSSIERFVGTRTGVEA
jgi:hypothetical protein